MKIALGENLRSLRNRENITQEQLAEALEVSPQAVSRWENEATFPDISLLPIIANYFNVTTDYLLGVDTCHKQGEIAKVIEADEKLRYEGKTKESVEFLREKVKEFPSDSNMLLRLACCYLTRKTRKREITGNSEKTRFTTAKTLNLNGFKQF